jgi:hypothetical protein
MKRLIGTLALLVLLVNLAQAQSTRQAATKQDKAAKSANLQAAAASNVTGSGTPGRLSKWVGTSGSNTFVLGDSNILEDKFGKVGIGTPAPTSPLTVQGMIETTMGGYKFPDGTIQSTAFSAGQVVSSLNGLKGDVILAAGSNLTITPSGNTLTIAAPNALSAVAHDATLTGNGTSGSPLGVAVPLVLSGRRDEGGILRVTNTNPGGEGVVAIGGDNSIGSGGKGVRAIGGDSDSGFGGLGVEAAGGFSASGLGGDGVFARGGSSLQLTAASGGDGVVASGGAGRGAGNSGGNGITATAGQGLNGATSGLAGKFLGDVQVSGNLSKGAGSFKIDHPLDPENRYLYHSFVESPDMKNIYDGNVTTDESGDAVVTLPDYFEALNRDFRYQLTVVGTFAQAIVAEKIRGNRFCIKTNAPNVEVSWQVTGIRQDVYANRNRINVEEGKPERERGYYLHPEAFNQPEERSVEWARRPVLMQQLKQQRIEAEQLRKPPLPNQR